MPHPLFSKEEIARRGKALYEERIRPQIDTSAYLGKVLSIDIETGDYEIGDDPVETGQRLHAKRPGAAVWTERIGYNAVYALGGTLTRTPS